MMLNSYAVLAVFFALLRLGLGVVVLACGAFGWRRWHAGGDRTTSENAGHLAFLLAVTLVLLGIASWPLLYLLLQSYVPEWPGAMCIYGVTQVGAGSTGPARHLPGLLRAMQVLKPALVFAGGAWYVLYLLDRRARGAPLLGRLFALLLPLGVLAVGDSVADLTYMSIPKREEFPAAGCCTAIADSTASRFLPRSWVGEGGRPQLWAAYGASNVLLMLMIAAGWANLRRLNVLVALSAVVNVAVSGVFLVEVFAPSLLDLPFHHCAYDLIPDAPEGVIAVALNLIGSFGVGWIVTLHWLGGADETWPHAAALGGALARLSLWCLATSLVMVNVALVLA
jgi:hypothetical protein